VDRLLFERAIAPLCGSVGFRLLHKTEAGADAPLSDPLEKMIRQLLTAVIHPLRQLPNDVSSDTAVDSQQTL
jgi:hypothetical protein